MVILSEFNSKSLRPLWWRVLITWYRLCWNCGSQPALYQNNVCWSLSQCTFRGNLESQLNLNATFWSVGGSQSSRRKDANSAQRSTRSKWVIFQGLEVGITQLLQNKEERKKEEKYIQQKYYFSQPAACQIYLHVMKYDWRSMDSEQFLSQPSWWPTVGSRVKNKRINDLLKPEPVENVPVNFINKGVLSWYAWHTSKHLNGCSCSNVKRMNIKCDNAPWFKCNQSLWEKTSGFKWTGIIH